MFFEVESLREQKRNLKNVSNPLSCHSEKVESLYDPVTAQANKGNFFVTVIKLLLNRNH